MDAVREDMAVVEVTEEDAEGRTEWRPVKNRLWRPDPPREKRKEEEGRV